MEKKEKVAPFAMRFQEKITEEDVAQVEGRYNEKTRMWEWPKDPDNPSVVMSFPQQERPPTTCIRPTRITVDLTRADTVVDD